MITRTRLIDHLRRAMEALPFVNAAWLGGSDAFGSADEMSDVDLCLDVADGHGRRALDEVEKAALELSPIAARWSVPEPAWHGHRQVFLRLRDAPETLLVDVVAMERSAGAERFDEREQHGEPVVLFDRLGVARSRSLDREAHGRRLRDRLRQLRAREPLFGGFAAKEAARGRALDALWAYQAFLVAPLIEALRMRSCPERFAFGQRYLGRDLPPEEARRLAELAFVGSLADLPAKAAEARAWLREVLEDLEA